MGVSFLDVTSEADHFKLYLSRPFLAIFDPQFSTQNRYIQMRPFPVSYREKQKISPVPLGYFRLFKVIR